MLAYFTEETVLAPLGLLSGDHRKVHSRASACRLQNGEAVFDLGSGNGMVCIQRDNHSRQSDISCLFAGDEQSWPDFQHSTTSGAYLPEHIPKKHESAASWLQALLTASEGDFFGHTGFPAYNALDSIGKLQGPFAFVVYDGANHRVLAARDRKGAQDLFWGVTGEGELSFSTSLEALEGCNPTATAFPAGSVFVSACRAKASQPGSQGWMIDNRVIPGTLHSFVKASLPPKPSGKPTQPSFKSVKAVPRINSQGCLCGAVYRVASDRNLADWGSTY